MQVELTKAEIDIIRCALSIAREHFVEYGERARKIDLMESAAQYVRWEAGASVVHQKFTLL